MEEFLSLFLIYFCVPVTLNNGWHLIDTRYLFVEWMNDWLPIMIRQHFIELLGQRHSEWGASAAIICDSSVH